MVGPKFPDQGVYRRVARRVQDILKAARERERKGQTLALDIEARFRLDVGAIQFQLACAILEEVGGLQQEEVVSELLSLGLASVLAGAARAAGEGMLSPPIYDQFSDTFNGDGDELFADESPASSRFPGYRMLN